MLTTVLLAVLAGKLGYDGIMTIAIIWAVIKFFINIAAISD